MKLFDNSKREMTIQEGCPWYEAQQTYGAPNVNWCEKTQCNFVTEPANTWSNLSFILVGLLLIFHYRDNLIKFFGFFVTFVGLTSGFYHLTNNFLTQFIDLIGMNLASAFILAFSASRIFEYLKNKFYLAFMFFAVFNITALSIMEMYNIALQLIFFVTYLFVISFEFYAGHKENRLSEYKYFVLALFFIALGQACAQLDLKRILCNENNIFLHGHVFWHLFSSLALYFFARHMNLMRSKN